MQYVVFLLMALVLDVAAMASIVGAGRPMTWKLLWSAVVLLIPVLGMVVYFIMGD